MTNLVGVFIGYHDSNVCAVKDGQILYRKFERRSGEKHHRATLADIVDTCSAWDVEPDYIAYSDGDRNNLGSCRVDELYKEVNIDLGFRSPCKTYCIDHHYAHILSTKPVGDLPAGSIGLALDGRGDNNVRVRVIRLGENHEADNLYHSTGFAVGKFFSRVGAYLGLEGQVVDRAGKVAGAQAFGHFDVEFADALASDDPETLPRRLLDEIPWRGLIPAGDPSFFSVENPSFLSWLTTCHKILERSVLRFIAERTGSARLHCYAGGVAQNSVFNEAFCRTHPNLLIPPHCYDGGLSIGCIEFLCRLLNMPFPAWPAFPFAQDDEDVGYAGSDNLEKVVDLLISGKVVGWMQGHGEIGPRALGHRSILMDPRRADAKDLLNERVKKREFWRPYAGSVLEEYASSWFATSVPSPHMLRAIATLKPRWGEIPAVVHFDGTCRIQTVSSDLPELASYRQLIKRFFDRTGVPLILNSSLNGGGEPIFGWAGQGLDMFRSGRLDALCIGDVLHLR